MPTYLFRCPDPACGAEAESTDRRAEQWCGSRPFLEWNPEGKGLHQSVRALAAHPDRDFQMRRVYTAPNLSAAARGKTLPIHHGRDE